MAEATVVGRTRVSITPDTSKVGPTLLAELPKAVRPGAIKAGDVIADTITAKVRGAVAKMKPVVKVGLDLDTAATKTALDKLTAARTIKLDISLDTGSAKAKLDKLTADRTVSVTADLDDKAATAALDKLTKDRKVKVSVDVDETTAKTKLDALLGQRTVDVLPKIQQAAHDRAKQQLDKLCADRVVNIRASVDTRVGANEIRNLTQRRQVRIGIDVDTRVAADSLANLTRRRQMTVQARADTTAANTALNHAARDRTANIRVRSTGLGALTAGLGSLGSSSGGGAGGIGMLGGRIAMLGGAALSALPAIASLGSVIAQMGSLAATAAPALGLLVGSFAAIKVGTSGVGDAIKAALNPVASEAKQAATATRQVENAQRSLARAQRAVQDAQRQAAERVADANRRVTDAERDLSRAQRDARQAQQDLTAARRQAVRDLQDMNQQLASGRLSEEEAALAVQQAELDLQETRSDPTATQLQIQQAELAHQRSMQSLDQQRTELARLEQDTAAANRAGVEGAKAVTDAKRQIAGANEQVADRERALIDAQRGVAKAQAEGQRDVADAQRAVADAVRQVAEAQETAAAQTTKLADAMDKLSPNARAFVTTLQQMAPAWRSMKLDVQDTLFAGLGTRLQQVGTQILPTVRTGLMGAADELNLMGRNALGAVSNLEKTGTLRQVFDGLRQNLGNLSRIPGQLVTGFGQLSVAAQPAFNRMTGGLAESMDRAMAKMGKAFEDGRLEKAISTALDVAVQFGGVLADLGGIFAGIFKAAGNAGGDFFGVIGAAIKEIRRVVEMPEVQAALTQIFKALNAVAGLLAGALGTALQALLPLLAAMAPVVIQLAEQLGPILAQVFETLGAALMPIVEALMPVIGEIVTVIADVAVMLLPLLQPVGELLGAIVVALAPLITMIGENFKTVIGALVEFLAPVIMALIPAVQLFGNLFAQLAPMFPPLYKALLPLLPPLTTLALSLITLAVQVLTPLMPLIVMLAGLLTKMLGGAIKFLVPIINTVIGWFTKFTDACTVAVKWVVDRFKKLFDILLGHSIIPDIVRGAIDWFSRMWKRLVKIVTDIKDDVVKFFRDLKDGAVKVWDSFWNRVRSIASDARKAVSEGVSAWGERLEDAFRTVRDSVGKVWKGIQNLVKAPIKFWIETVYNAGIRKVWNNTAAKIPGIDTLDEMPMPKGFARGGVLPGYSTWRQGDDQLVPMRRGEGVYVSEAMRDPYERARLFAVNQAAMAGRSLTPFRGFAEGGILGGLRGVGSSIASSVGDALDRGKDAVRGGLADLAEKAFKPVKSGITKALGDDKKTFSGAMGHAPIHLIDKAIEFIRGKDIPEASGQWMKPVKAPYGTPFGKRGSMWSSGRHTGLDFPAATGTKVVAADSGTVGTVKNGGPYGKHVTINHGGGLASLYAHLSSMVATAGDGIKKGTKIGAVGATGNVTGPHLHLEARVNGRTVNPMDYLAGGGDVGGHGVQRWAGTVRTALGQLNQSMSLVNTTLRRMNQESGGNPKAVNRSDINWQRGTPSVGLMQVIEPTFRAFAGRYKNVGPKLYGVSTDPLANVYASMRYALRTYGSLPRAYNRPGGYAMGGIVRVNRGLPGGYAKGGIIRVAGKRIDTGPLAAAVGADFLKALTGTAKAIDTAMTKVATAVKNAFKGVKTTLDDRLLKRIAATNKQLQALSKQRDAIAAKIVAAKELAKDATEQATGFASMTGLPNAGNTFDAGGILSGLNVRLGQLKKFGANLKILGDRGLNKNLLQQLISAGPEQGAAYAQALVDATPTQLKAINATQISIDKAAGQFGKDAADAMYDAGAQSGKGYLTGLASTQKAIEAQMAKIAKAIQKTIKVELKIKSPSRVLENLGRFTGQGFARGVARTVPEAQAAALRMATAVRATAAATTARIQNSQTIRNGGDRHLHYQAMVREVAPRKAILDALAMDDMLNRTVVV
ncbi:peptidoglycan DD-metalloendopeptidase family protein [Streptomyces sp. NPDC001812]|uniref:peptidoglycan DD-metalloendopeptidase family protein n=1 Tax=Streptomyces sp. NPDC001812 TaxID=3364611 RepID=UPI00369E429A